jgi:hypothetical protein
MSPVRIPNATAKGSHVLAYGVGVGVDVKCMLLATLEQVSALVRKRCWPTGQALRRLRWLLL